MHPQAHRTAAYTQHYRNKESVAVRQAACQVPTASYSNKVKMHIATDHTTQHDHDWKIHSRCEDGSYMTLQGRTSYYCCCCRCCHWGLKEGMRWIKGQLWASEAATLTAPYSHTGTRSHLLYGPKQSITQEHGVTCCMASYSHTGTRCQTGYKNHSQTGSTVTQETDIAHSNNVCGQLVGIRPFFYSKHGVRGGGPGVWSLVAMRVQTMYISSRSSSSGGGCSNAQPNTCSPVGA